MRPMLLPPNSVNQRAPSGPAVMPAGSLLAVGTANSVTTPAVVMRPILSADTADSVNQRAPSGPAVMPTGLLLAVGTANSRILPESARALGAASVSTQMSRLKSPANREKRREM